MGRRVSILGTKKGKDKGKEEEVEITRISSQNLARYKYESLKPDTRTRKL